MAIFAEQIAVQPLCEAKLGTEDMQDQRSDGGFAIALNGNFQKVFGVVAEPLLPAGPLFVGVLEEFLEGEMHGVRFFSVRLH